jgi:hypothetical protein
MVVAIIHQYQNGNETKHKVHIVMNINAQSAQNSHLDDLVNPCIKLGLKKCHTFTHESK